MGVKMREKKIIYCEKCVGEIKSRDDLVVTNKCIYIVPYHEKCFSKELKGVSTIFVGNEPINGTSSNIFTVLAVILGIVVLFIQELRFLSVVSLLILCVRLYSWIQYERHL